MDIGLKLYERAYISHAINIDHRDIDERHHEISAYKASPVVVYCFSGIRAAMVESTLIAAGFSKVFHLQGDCPAWKNVGLPITKSGKNEPTTASTHPPQIRL